MTTNAWWRVVLACAAALGAGCDATRAPFEDGGAPSTARAPILGGTLDTTHDAVMALLRIRALRAGDGVVDACSGTTIATRGSSGFFLTAAHCLVDSAPDSGAARPIAAAELGLLPGADWLTSYDANETFGVAAVHVHPAYDGSIESAYDVGLVRFVGATEATPVIPPLAPEEDELVAGDRLTLVGYGVTSTGLESTLRMQVEKTIEAVTPSSVRYAQADGAGTCSGDSGGPALVATDAGARVAATTTYGDARCSEFGEGARTSSVAEFLTTVIESAPVELDCLECRLASTAPAGRCAAAASACAVSSGPCALFTACAARCEDARCRAECERESSRGGADAVRLRDCECGADCASVCGDHETCREASPERAADLGAAPDERGGTCALSAGGGARSLEPRLLALLAAALLGRRRVRSRRTEPSAAIVRDRSRTFAKNRPRAGARTRFFASKFVHGNEPSHGTRVALSRRDDDELR